MFAYLVLHSLFVRISFCLNFHQFLPAREKKRKSQLFIFRSWSLSVYSPPPPPPTAAETDLCSFPDRIKPTIDFQFVFAAAGVRCPLLIIVRPSLEPAGRYLALKGDPRRIDALAYNAADFQWHETGQLSQHQQEPINNSPISTH